MLAEQIDNTAAAAVLFVQYTLLAENVVLVQWHIIGTESYKDGRVGLEMIQSGILWLCMVC